MATPFRHILRGTPEFHGNKQGQDITEDRLKARKPDGIECIDDQNKLDIFPRANQRDNDDHPVQHHNSERDDVFNPLE